MDLRLKNFFVFNEKNVLFHNGITFIITDNKNFQKEMIEALSNKSADINIQIYVDEVTESIKDLKKQLYYVNYQQSSFFKKNQKYKKMIDVNSEIVHSLDIQKKVFNLRFKQLWHWSYLCSCAIGISKGKRILIFPWIDSKECSVQAYRLSKLFEYSLKNEIIVIVPTNNIDDLDKNPLKKMVYNVI